MQIKYPDYNNSILSIASSVLKHYGAKCDHKSLPKLDDLLLKNYKNVVVMLFDGMGESILKKHLPIQSFFRRNQVSVISSVFPPTTTAAITTLQTGMSPIEHGWLGWSLYFDEIGGNVNLFPNTISGEGVSAAEYHVANKYIPTKQIFEKIQEATNGEVQGIPVSAFSNYNSKSSKEICDTVKNLCSEEGRKYIFTYWHQPDYDMHDLGTTHEKIAADIKQFNDEVEEMCSNLSETLVVITADHGLVDTSWHFIPDYPEIEMCLSKKPSIESRAMTFFVKEGCHSRFEKEFKDTFSDIYLLMTKKEVLDKKLFGEGVPHLRSEGFIGDYLAVATGSASIECSPSTQHDLFKAAHAGMTANEMNVPLIVVERL